MDITTQYCMILRHRDGTFSVIDGRPLHEGTLTQAEAEAFLSATKGTPWLTEPPKGRG